MEWKEEYFKMIDDFRKRENRQLRHRYDRLILIANLETENDFELRLLPKECQFLYTEAKECFVHGTYRGAIIVMETALTTLLFKNIRLEDIKDRWPEDSNMLRNNKTGKETIVQINNTRNLTFNNLIDLAEDKQIITGKLAKELHVFRWIRHGVAHYELVQKSHLGFKWTSVRGEGTKVFGYSFESPFLEVRIIEDEKGNQQEKMLPAPIKMYNLFEGAKKGFDEFFNLFTVLQTQNDILYK